MLISIMAWNCICHSVSVLLSCFPFPLFPWFDCEGDVCRGRLRPWASAMWSCRRGVSAALRSVYPLNPLSGLLSLVWVIFYALQEAEIARVPVMWWHPSRCDSVALWVTAPRRKRIYSLIQRCWAPVKHHSKLKLSNPSRFFSISLHTMRIVSDATEADSWDIWGRCFWDLSLHIPLTCSAPELCYHRGRSHSCIDSKPPGSHTLWRPHSKILMQRFRESQ